MGMTPRTAAPPPSPEGTQTSRTLASGCAHLLNRHVPPLPSPKVLGVRQPIPPSFLPLSPPIGQHAKGGALGPPKRRFLGPGALATVSTAPLPGKHPLASSYRATKPQGSPGARTLRQLLPRWGKERLSVLLSPLLPNPTALLSRRRSS